MKLSGMVQDVVDASYDGKKGHVSCRQVQVVEIGSGAFHQVIGIQVPSDGCKFKAGDRVEVTIEAFRGEFSNIAKVQGRIEAVK